MAKRSNYEVEDFLLDESFIEWVLKDSEKEATFWTAWIGAHPGCLPAMNAARKILLVLHFEPSRQLTDPEIDIMVSQLQQNDFKTHERFKLKLLSKTKRPLLALQLAAMLTICFGVGYIFFKQNKSSNPGPASNYVKHVVNNTKGSLLIRLADESSIILKPGARINYPLTFTGKNREVSLTGEAFFEIHKDPLHPFFVHSGDWVTRVVGTSFTIKACDKTKEFKITVNTGKVLVYKNVLYDSENTSLKYKRQGTKAVYILPNQKVVYNTTRKMLMKENVTRPLLLSADSSRALFTFHETPFDRVITNIRRVYNVNITYNKEQMGGCPITASLADEHLLEKLDIICKAFDAKYSIKDGQIIIKGQGCNSK